MFSIRPHIAAVFFFLIFNPPAMGARSIVISNPLYVKEWYGSLFVGRLMCSFSNPTTIPQNITISYWNGIGSSVMSQPDVASVRTLNTITIAPRGFYEINWQGGNVTSNGTTNNGDMPATIKVDATDDTGGAKGFLAGSCGFVTFYNNVFQGSWSLSVNGGKPF